MNPLAMIDMKSKLKGNNIQNNNIQNRDTNRAGAINQFTMNNLTHIEERIIKEIIHGDLVAENDSGASPVISLDEAVKKIKNGR